MQLSSQPGLEYYPTAEHRRAVERFVELFSRDDSVVAILLSGSCARGKATKDSDIDMTVVVRNRQQIRPITSKFQRANERVAEFTDLRKVGQYSNLEANVITGRFRPSGRDWTSGPDEFELAIGNALVYSTVLFERGGSLESLRSRYLPYYSEELQLARLDEAKKYLYNNLDHIPLYVSKGLYFASFSRFYNASREFLQALFIKNKTYPIAYDKWIREQLVDILGQPDIYRRLVDLMQVRDLESQELAEKGEELREIAATYL